MKTINVMVMIQLDIKGIDTESEVKDSLEVINNIIAESNLDSQPQLFINNINSSDILEPLFDSDEKVDEIKRVIAEWGAPNWSDEGWGSIVYQAIGQNHKVLIESIGNTSVGINTYVHEMFTDESEVDFEDLEEEIIDELYELIVNQYGVECEKTHKRCQD